MAAFWNTLKLLLTFLTLAIAVTPPETDYDVIIVGGGPAGLSAQSALCRVSRTSILFDHGIYRNEGTRNMHDVIGNDGTRPVDFRAAARAQIAKYKTGEYKAQTTIRSIFYENINGFRVFTVYDLGDVKYTARRVILATGIVDVLPSFLHGQDLFGKGVYWCPWCDAFEHRGQPLGVIGDLSNIMGDVIELKNVNPDIIILADGSDTPEEREKLRKKWPDFERQLEHMSVRIINDKITRIRRLDDGSYDDLPDECKLSGQNPTAKEMTGKPCTPWDEDAGPGPAPDFRHYDRFEVQFQHNDPIRRAAFMITTPRKQQSELPSRLALQMAGEDRVFVYPGTVNTSIPGIYATGDMTNEGATNVPWAMYSGKKAGVSAHVALAKEDSLAAIRTPHPAPLFRRSAGFDEAVAERSAMQQAGEHMEKLWRRVESKYKK